jgi:predicted transcriptional regulator
MQSTELLEKTVFLVASYISRNAVPAGDLADVIKCVHAALAGLPPSDGPASNLVHRRPRDDGRASGRH